jgi:hypothetical protein
VLLPAMRKAPATAMIVADGTRWFRRESGLEHIL